MEIFVTLIAGSPGNGPSPTKTSEVVPLGSDFCGVRATCSSTGDAVLDAWVTK